MSSQVSHPTGTPWQLQSDQAQLKVGQFSACVDLANPQIGLQQINCDESVLAGQFLGISAGKLESSQSLVVDEAFTRGTDLIACFAETKAQPYSLEVYWRAFKQDRSYVVDLLLSVETNLLESFPSLLTQTQLVAEETCTVTSDGTAELITDFAQVSPIQEAACLILRPPNSKWSYVEMPHPEDLGETTASRDEQGRTTIRRILAGSFMEKGVIRRLRIRGAVVPRKDDVQLATQLLNGLVTEAPPLTA